MIILSALNQWCLPVPIELNRAQLDKLSNLLTCNDEEAVDTWRAILEMFGLADAEIRQSESGAMACEQLAAHLQARSPDDIIVGMLNRSADAFRDDAKSARLAKYQHGPDCSCEPCYLQYNY